MNGTISQPQVDLTNCASEPIHIPGRIQSFGTLLAVNADWYIVHRSANFGAFFGLSGDPAPGDSASRWLTPELIDTMRRRIGALRGENAVERLFDVEATMGGPRVDLALHTSGRLLVIEFERHPEDDADTSATLRGIMARLHNNESPSDLCAMAAREMRTLLGYDRVMVYRFHPDDSGEVYAEACRPGLESFHGLRYPSNDIPPQARELYLRNLLRIISDIDDSTVAVEPVTGPTGHPLDLSLSTLRAVSPIHIEYLRNMGVRASMSISIVIRGKLWGLFACHHYEPRVLAYGLRTTAELFAQMFALMLDQAIADRSRAIVDAGRQLHDRLMTQLADSSGLIENFDMMSDLIQEVIPHDGAAALVEGRYIFRGAAPTAEEIESLVPMLNTTAASSVFSTDSIGDTLPASVSFSDRAAGLLAIPVSRRPRDYLILFRRELAQTVSWGGKPEKEIEYGPNGPRLSPRQSFAEWKEVVRNRCRPWTDEEVTAAESLRVTLLEVILRITEAAMQERAKSQGQQELLIAELNHRVRNILNIIRGLVSQSQHEARDVGEFTELVSRRISALAMAHDNITRENWEPSSLRDLIATEVKAYNSGKSDRIEVSGGDALIGPEAYSVLALVLHEMFTNSVKYGSLSNSQGRLVIDIEYEAGGDLRLGWQEQNGPPVTPPERRGFGSLIIERSIPYELKGEAQVRYRQTGIEADFSIPARHLSAAEAPTDTGKPTPEGPVVAPTPQREELAEAIALPRRVLVVEDNMIIAIDTEETLIDMGVGEVVVASSNDVALAIVEGSPPDFALLDFNLGGETSEPVARMLDKLGIPFIFATGYGELEITAGDFSRQISVIQKPYSRADLKQAIAAAG